MNNIFLAAELDLARAGTSRAIESHGQSKTRCQGTKHLCILKLWRTAVGHVETQTMQTADCRLQPVQTVQTECYSFYLLLPDSCLWLQLALSCSFSRKKRYLSTLWTDQTRRFCFNHESKCLRIVKRLGFTFKGTDLSSTGGHTYCLSLRDANKCEYDCSLV